MRAGGCTLHQALTPEATTMVMQAVSLARRRGHAQVTPLHVASTMLSSSTGLLRAACLQSHSHPLQCKALELCFNVALNRLPASTSSTPMLTPHQHHHHHNHTPSLSNALVAAFKRAQAHQRRGSIESQQQPLLAVKIETEQLIISILDDPSVSRVMREAGFSSTQVKTNVEQALSLEMCSSVPSTSTKPNTEGIISSLAKTRVPEPVKREDITSVIDCLVKKRRRSIVVVGECLPAVENVVRAVMDKVDGGDSPELLRGAQLINLPISSFAHLSEEEVEHKVGELRCLIMSCCMGRGAVLYLGDLRWAAEYRTSPEKKGRNYYCPVEHAIVEIGRLACSGMNTGRFWIMAVATFQTYIKCRSGNPSLESLWGLHPLTVPAGSLDLSLTIESNLENPLPFQAKEDGGSNHGSPNSNMPSWLQQLKDNASSASGVDVGQSRDICIKWNSTYQPLTQQKGINFPLVTSASFSSYDKHCAGSINQAWAPLSKEHHFFVSDSRSDTHKLVPVSTSSSDTMEMEYQYRFKELNAENHKTLCNAMESKVPWQRDIIPEIASTILRCRSGMTRRKDDGSGSSRKPKEETWLVFQGSDSEGKDGVWRELASLLFGSSSEIITIGVSSFGDDADRRKKRSRLETSHSNYLEKLFEAMRENPHRVFVLDDVDQADPISQMGIVAAMESGILRGSSSGEEIGVQDAVVIFSCETLDGSSRACSSPQVKQRVEGEDEKESFSCGSLDLNLLAEEEEVERCHCRGLVESADRTFVFKSRDDSL